MTKIPTRQVASLLGISPNAVWRLVAAGKLNPAGRKKTGRQGREEYLFSQTDVMVFKQSRGCPGCGKKVKPAWNFCLFCLVKLQP